MKDHRSGMPSRAGVVNGGASACEKDGLFLDNMGNFVPVLMEEFLKPSRTWLAAGQEPIHSAT